MRKVTDGERGGGRLGERCARRRRHGHRLVGDGERSIGSPGRARRGRAPPDTRAGVDADHAGDVRSGQRDRPALRELSRASRPPSPRPRRTRPPRPRPTRCCCKHYPAEQERRSTKATRWPWRRFPTARPSRPGGDRRASGRRRRWTPTGSTRRSRQPPYRPRTAPGEWIGASPPSLEPYWFGVQAVGREERRGAACPPPPPALDQRHWARDYEEVRRLGARTSKERTPGPDADRALPPGLRPVADGALHRRPARAAGRSTMRGCWRSTRWRWTTPSRR